jgi:hypothetical protein
MSKHFLVIVFSVCLAGVGGWALAQPRQPGQPAADNARGRYAVSAAGQSAVLLETTTGRTWVLAQSVEGTSVWLPAHRLDSDEQLHEWLKLERERAATRDAMQREMAKQLESLGKKPAQK